MKVAIINRGFWPLYPVIGEALLTLAECLVKDGHKVSVLCQSPLNLIEELEAKNRGAEVLIKATKAFTNSSSGVVSRIFDAIYFASWVLYSLIRARPDRVYVSTDPPVVVPLIVGIYCQCSKAEFVYHLQDIHPEATDAIMPMNRWVFNTIKLVDAFTMRCAAELISITPVMAHEITSRMKVERDIHVLDNPAVSRVQSVPLSARISGFSFCGNAGRLQRIPLLVSAIREYIRRGGTLSFVFAGGGVFACHLEKLASEFLQVDYRGVVNAKVAAEISASLTWALLPIEDEITKFAFPSKSSTYVTAGAQILGICGEDTSVARWIRHHDLGIVVEPKVEDIVAVFFEVEAQQDNEQALSTAREHLVDSLSLDKFVLSLKRVLVG